MYVIVSCVAVEEAYVYLLDLIIEKVQGWLFL